MVARNLVPRSGFDSSSSRKAHPISQQKSFVSELIGFGLQPMSSESVSVPLVGISTRSVSTWSASVGDDAWRLT